MRTPKKNASALLKSQPFLGERFNFKHSTAATGKQVTVPGVPVLEWVNTSTLSELCSAVNKLSRLFNITCNSFAVSDNNIDYMLIRLYDFCEVLALHGQSIISLHQIN